jgi:hypothetical protein
MYLFWGRKASIEGSEDMTAGLVMSIIAGNYFHINSGGGPVGTKPVEHMCELPYLETTRPERK